VILLPGTLSTARQLDRLAGELARDGALAVHALDRRGIGSSRLTGPGPLDITVHVDDLRGYLDARGIAAAVLVGHSFGGVLALEAAARLPGRIRAVVAYEPPYGPLADDATRDRFARTASRTAEAYREGGAALAAETFLRIVAGDTAWTSLPERSRAWLAREGLGAVTDSPLAGLDPEGLARIQVPVRVLGGGASLPFYPRIAAALVDRIAGASHVQLPGLTHNGPITDPVPVAAAVRACLAEDGVRPDGQPREPRR
jgi:pimeloyl-ACP methyl ester carboxylesterase